MIAIIRLIAVGLSWAPLAHADPPNTVLIAARLHLSTTSFESDFKPFSDTYMGLARSRSSKGKIALPALVVDGYVARSSAQGPIDVSKKLQASELARKGGLRFWPLGDLVSVKHPEHLLLSTGTPAALTIPLSVVTNIEKISGEFDGHRAYGQPFYLPAD